MVSIPELLTSEDSTINFMLVGVGGQGTILASNLLADVGLVQGHDVKKAEIHGMSQRGGSVTSYVRWGKNVFSPIISKGDAQVLIAFEKMEAVRYIDSLQPGGLVLVNDYAIVPVTVISGDSGYPDNMTIQSTLEHMTPDIHWINGMKIAERAGNDKTANVVILGALSALMGMEAESWVSVLEKRLTPKLFEVNRKAFLLGRKAVT